MQAAMAVARVTIHNIALISLHGTGTPLGDPIEVGALGTTTSEPVQLCTAPLVLGAAITLSLSSQYLRWACKACQYDMQEQNTVVSWLLHILALQIKHIKKLLQARVCSGTRTSNSQEFMRSSSGAL